MKNIISPIFLLFYRNWSADCIMRRETSSATNSQRLRVYQSRLRTHNHHFPVHSIWIYISRNIFMDVSLFILVLYDIIRTLVII